MFRDRYRHRRNGDGNSVDGRSVCLLNADPLVIVAALAGSAATLLVVYTILLRKVINDQRDDAWQTGYGVGRKDGATNYVNPSAEEDTSEESATTDSA